jgi:DNA topoisomerase-1
MNHSSYLRDPGIYKQNGVFYYTKKNKIVTDPKTLERVNSFVVPPAWKNVWYASSSRCHIQVHGIDTGGKKQYILSQKWINNAKYSKFQRMKTFMKDLGSFKRKIKLKSVVLNKETLTHLLFHLLLDLHIRVGNEIYVPNSYGLTTLRQKHLKWVNGKYQFQFIGKSGIEHIVDIPSEYTPWFDKLRGNSQNKHIFLFQGTPIQSEDLNEYLKRFMGKEYTCKDFRTYSANILFIHSFLKNAKKVLKQTQVKKCVLHSIDESAKLLGHTRNISRKSYISNTLLDYCLDSFDKASKLSTAELLGFV